MTDLFREPGGTTPLEPEERDGLRQTWITHRRDLNEAERENILKGATWVRGQRSSKLDQLLSVEFAKTLHARMLGDVWEWAGKFRLTERNIGIEAHQIGSELAKLMADVRYWVENRTYLPDEIAVRLHHRLVAVHPFRNGNGRHARLLADALVERLGNSPFTWGSGSLHDAGELRARYVAALRAADRHDLQPLVAFARA
jgi:Fic-DOC domain mobile mystery protein B